MRPYGMRRFRAYDGADIHWAARRGRGRARAEAKREASALLLNVRLRGKTGFWLQLLGVLPDEEP